MTTTSITESPRLSRHSSRARRVADGVVASYLHDISTRHASTVPRRRPPAQAAHVGPSSATARTAGVALSGLGDKPVDVGRQRVVALAQEVRRPSARRVSPSSMWTTRPPAGASSSR
jgi:hypothetical protein